MENKKRKIIISIMLAIISVSAILGITYSKYINKVVGDGETQIAKWYFSVNGDTEEMATIKLADTYHSNTLVGGKIAPGTSGSFDLVIDTSSSEVGVKYQVKFENETNKPANLKFKYQDQILDEIKDYEQYFTDVINADDENKTRTLTVEWQWLYETENENTTINENDEIDTKDGLNALDYKFDLLITGTQVIPSDA